MILWHTGDAWLREDLREGQAWLTLRFVGGLAAPSFIFLAGCAAALSARQTRDEAERQQAFLNAASRGLEIVLLGYALRLQTWLLDAGALTQWWLLRAWLPILVGYCTVFVALRRLPQSVSRALPLASAGLSVAVVGFVQVEGLAPGRFARLLQVDVLQAIGASLVLLAVAQRTLGLLHKPAALALAALVVALCTNFFMQRMPGPLPTALAGYIAKFQGPPGGPLPTLFPLFPWFAYALLGAAWGALLRSARGREESLVVLSAVLGAALALATSEAQPFVHAWMGDHPWLVQPVRVSFRVGLVLTVLLVGWLWTVGSRGKLGLAFGQNSLRVYWAHLLFAYGVLGRPLQKRLDFTGWMLWLVPLFGLMWGLTRISSVARRSPHGATVSPTKSTTGNVRT